MPRLRLAVLVSGRGTNLRSLLEASRAGTMAADVVLVVSNKPDAPALEVARAAGVRVEVVPSAGLSREAHEARIAALLDEARADLVALAGYMRILTPGFIERYHGRLVNIHPSLLPAFPGVDAQAQAAARGVRIAGCTTHFVTEEVDGGPIIVQAAVALPPGADAETVRDLVLQAEHVLYPRTIHLLATGAVRLEGGRVVHAHRAKRAAQPASILLPPEVDG